MTLKHTSMVVVTPAAAEKAGFRPVTIGYDLPKEMGMMSRVLDDLKRGPSNNRVETALVAESDGISIWRK